MPQLIYTLLPLGIKGLAVVVLLVVVLSTVGSHLHAAGLALAHDLAKRLDKTIDGLVWTGCSSTLLIGLVVILLQLCCWAKICSLKCFWTRAVGVLY